MAFNHHRWTLSNILPVVFVLGIIAAIWSTYVGFHLRRLLQLHEAEPDQDLQRSGVVQTVVSQTLLAMMMICFVRAVFTNPGSVPDTEAWLREENRNHKYFFLLVLYSALNCWFIVVTMASTVYRAGIDEMDPGYRFGLVFGMTLAVIMGTLLGCFFFFHCWLMSNASTTIEFCEKTTAAYGSRAVSYDQGLFENIRAVLGPFVSLWLLPVAPPHGDGVNFFVHNSKGDHDEMAPLLPGNQDSETAAPEVVRMLQERDMALFQQAFDDEDVDARQVLSIPAASRAFANAGFAKCAQPAPSDWTSTEMSLVGIVTRDGFVRACLKHVRMLRQAIIKNGGWTDPEVENLKVLFQKYDLSKSGRICNKEMIQLVEDIVPELAHERSMRPQLLALVREVDQDMVGLNFQDFLRLMALFRAFKDKQRLRKEQQAIKDCGFSHAEVADFRELFLNSLEDSPDLSFDDFRQMIHGITPLGDVLTAQLREIFLAQCKKEADFPDFLLLMKRLLDSDFANIKERSAKPRG
ncbi:unnamed protein product [Effrenium voratum]|nr:unnamed protein product [Effrenium voratum]